MAWYKVIDENTISAQTVSNAYHVLDYNNTAQTINIGYAGSSLTNYNYLAAYLKDTTTNQIYIKDVAAASVSVGYASSAGTVNWNNIVGKPSSIEGNYLPLDGGGMVTSSDAGVIKVKRTVPGGGAYIHYFQANQDTNYWEVGSSADNKFIFCPNGGSSVFSIGTSGDVSTSKISLSDGLYITSDKRKKEHIEDITEEDAKNVVNALRPVKFDWIEIGKHAHGFIAQEVEEIIPEAVQDNGIKSLQYLEIIPYLTKEIQRLNKEIERLSSSKNL